MYQVGAEIALAVQKYILNSRTSQALKFWVKFKEIVPKANSECSQAILFPFVLLKPRK